VGTLVEECIADILHQPPRYTPAPVFRRHRQAIDVTAPSVPSTDDGTRDPAVDYRDKEDRTWLLDQTGQSLD
jgi:hypothetical protein